MQCTIPLKPEEEAKKKKRSVIEKLESKKVTTHFKLFRLRFHICNGTRYGADLDSPGALDFRPPKNRWEALLTSDEGLLDEDVGDVSFPSDSTTLVEGTGVREDVDVAGERLNIEIRSAYGEWRENGGREEIGTHEVS